MTTLCTNAYLIDAWMNMIYDYGADPFITVNPNLSEREMVIPMEYLDNGFLTLNASSAATGYVNLDKQTGYLTMSSRFNGIVKDMMIPMEAIVIVRSRCGKLSFNTPPHLMLMGDDVTTQMPTPADNNIQPSIEPAPHPDSALDEKRPLANGVPGNKPAKPELRIVDGDTHPDQPVRPKRQTPKLYVVKNDS